MSTPIRLLPQFRGHKCLNCDTPLEIADRFCHHCGQINSTKKLALSDFFQEFLASFISYDSRIWRTISGILFRPGVITREYCAGKRVHYANPFRFFLTVSIVFFLLIQLVMNWNGSIEDSKIRNNNSSFFQMENDSLTGKEVALQLTKTRDSLRNNGDQLSSSLLTKIIEQQDTTSVRRVGPTRFISQEKLDEENFIIEYFSQTGAYMDHYEANKNMTVEEALEDLNHRNDKTNRLRYLKAIRYQGINKNPDLMLTMVIPKVPLFLFFFAPILSLFLWLAYARSSYNFMEHMVFTFHLFTFIFLSMFLILGLKAVTYGWVNLTLPFAALVGPYYLYKAMRTFYQQNRWKTLLKFVFINFVFLILFSISSAVFVIGSVFLSA
ncbi:DUF3667 domain-containing protein [Nonlabens marinus]|uniref:Gll1812 protein n=1 Tax=Nonlabens marinus S1-08 TaxID=1454201 RepID=W8VQY2_9FLAO|nr:DUF3667 domain-containing protein [Nonlabens marinus]BAO55325.1 gll1812 protein [Nonlabens marinus S1-08]